MEFPVCIPAPFRFKDTFSEWLLHTAGGNRNRENGGVNNVGSNGNYWSAASNSATNSYNLNFNSGTVNPQNNNNRANGFSVRPVVRPLALDSGTFDHLFFEKYFNT